MLPQLPASHPILSPAVELPTAAPKRHCCAYMCHSWVANGGHLGISHHHCSVSLHTGHTLLAHSITSQPAGAAVVGWLVTVQPYAADDQLHCCQLPSPLPRTTHARRHAQACQRVKDRAGAVPHAPPATQAGCPCLTHSCSKQRSSCCVTLQGIHLILNHACSHAWAAIRSKQASGVYAAAHLRSLLHHRPARRTVHWAQAQRQASLKPRDPSGNQAMRVYDTEASTMA